MKLIFEYPFLFGYRSNAFRDFLKFTFLQHYCLRFLASDYFEILEDIAFF